MTTGQVLWLGGGCGAGKSTLAARLADRFDLRLYRVDVFAYPHEARRDPRRHPVMCEQAELDYRARMVDPSPERLATVFAEYAAERFAMIREDLAELESGPLVLAEGPSLLPELVAPMMPGPGYGLWLLPTTEFTDANLRARGGARPVTDEVARRAHDKRIARDAILTERMREAVRANGLTALDVDGSLTLDETEDRLAEHFTAALAAGPRAADAAERIGIRRAANAEMNAAVAAHREFLGERAPAEEPVMTYTCECGTPGCREAVRLTPSDYRAVSTATAH